MGIGALNAGELHQGEVVGLLSRVGSWYLQGNLAVYFRVGYVYYRVSGWY